MDTNKEHGKVSALLLRLPEASRNLEEYITVIRSILPQVSTVENHDAQKVIDALDEALNFVKPYPDFHRQCLLALRKICGSTGNLPSSYMITDGLEKLNDMPVTTGGYADVWKGVYGKTSVAIKSLRMYRTDEPDMLKKSFCKEVVVWKRLSHPNLLPLLGFSTSLFPFCMVSPWMQNGNITEYIRASTDNTGAIRMSLLIDVAKGLQYLHAFNIVHGDLKGANILVDDDGQARITDFGLTSIMSNFNSVNASTLVSRQNGTVRWMAPEVLDPESANIENLPSKGLSEASDVYAFAMVAIEIFTGTIPFQELRNDPSVIIKVMQGGRPARPIHAVDIGLTDNVWQLIEECWQQDRGKRPSTSLILDHLQSLQRTSLLERLEDFDPVSKSEIELIRSILSSKMDMNTLLTFGDQDAQDFVDGLDQAMESYHADAQFVQECFSGLLRLCTRTRLLPSSYRLSRKPDKSDNELICHGNFTDVWKGTHDNRVVALKMYKPNQDDIVLKTSFKEAVVWKNVEHRNIVLFLGVSESLVPETLDGRLPLCLVSPWMTNGPLMEYLRIHPKVNPLRLWSDVGKGLQHLHSLNIVHGNLRGDNVLVDDAARALISGFSHSVVLLPDTQDSFQHELWSQESVRWMAPEMLGPNHLNVAELNLPNGGYSKASDVYAFGMVFTEIFTGKIPFHQLDDEKVVIGQVIDGVRPEKLEHKVHSGFSDTLWELVETCWRHESNLRPEISHVLDRLQKITHPDVLSSTRDADSTCVSEAHIASVINNDEPSPKVSSIMVSIKRRWQKIKLSLRVFFVKLRRSY